MRSRRLIAAISAAVVVAAWSGSAFVAGIVAIVRDSKYLNDVMIPSLILIAVVFAVSVAFARRFWRRVKGRSDNRIALS